MQSNLTSIAYFKKCIGMVENDSKELIHGVIFLLRLPYVLWNPHGNFVFPTSIY